MNKVIFTLAFLMLSFLSNFSYSEEQDLYYIGGVNYSLNGPIRGAFSNPYEEGHAMVCGLRNNESYLSLREEADSKSKEIIKLNNFMIVNMTGEFYNSSWAKIDYFIIAADSEGKESQFGQIVLPISGWVYMSYLCDFDDHPGEEGLPGPPEGWVGNEE